MGSGPADVVPVRIDPELRAAIEARAEAKHTTTSEIIRAAIRRFLEVCDRGPAHIPLRGAPSARSPFLSGAGRRRRGGPPSTR